MHNLTASECKPGEYYMVSGISIFYCESPGVFITSQGKRTGAENAHLVHIPDYIAKGGEPFELGKEVDVNYDS